VIWDGALLLRAGGTSQGPSGKQGRSSTSILQRLPFPKLAYIEAMRAKLRPDWLPQLEVEELYSVQVSLYYGSQGNTLAFRATLISGTQNKQSRGDGAEIRV
jgi:hypothetical protein